MKIIIFLIPFFLNAEISSIKLKNFSDSSEKKLSQLLNKPYTLISVWASWCSTCKDELKELENFHILTKQKLDIITISIDSRKKRGAKFIRKNKLTLKTLWDPNQKILSELHLNGVPALVLLNKSGKILEKFNSFNKSTTIKKISERIIYE